MFTTAHLGQDYSDIKLGPPGWGFSTGLVPQSYKNRHNQIPQKRSWSEYADDKEKE
jgi:hypothetical protein